MTASERLYLGMPEAHIAAHYDRLLQRHRDKHWERKLAMTPVRAAA